MGDVPDPDPSLADDPVTLLQGLVRFDTTNPPGDGPGDDPSRRTGHCG